MPELMRAVVDAERVEAIVREEAARAAEGQLRWLTNRQACELLGGCSARTWERKKKALGIPKARIDGMDLYLRADIEAVLLRHTIAPETTVIAFPSAQLRKERAA